MDGGNISSISLSEWYQETLAQKETLFIDNTSLAPGDPSYTASNKIINFNNLPDEVKALAVGDGYHSLWNSEDDAPIEISFSFSSFETFELDQYYLDSFEAESSSLARKFDSFLSDASNSNIFPEFSNEKRILFETV